MKKHNHYGLIEYKNFRIHLKSVTYSKTVAKMFLLEIDENTQKVYATYGPFETADSLQSFATVHNIIIRNIES